MVQCAGCRVQSSAPLEARNLIAERRGRVTEEVPQGCVRECRVRQQRVVGRGGACKGRFERFVGRFGAFEGLFEERVAPRQLLRGSY